MNAPVQESLRRALAQQADGVKAPADAWERIEAVTRARHRTPFLRPPVLVPAMVMVMVMVGLAMALSRDDAGERVRVASDGSGRVYLAPTGLDGYRLTQAVTDPDLPPSTRGTRRVFARRGADGVTLPASVVVKIPSDQQPQVTGPDTETLRIGGEDLAVYRDQDGRLVVAWRQGDGQSVGLSAFGITDDEVVAVAESLRAGPAATVAPRLPEGFEVIQVGGLPTAPFLFTDQAWESRTEKFRLTVTEVVDASLDTVAWGHPKARAVDVRSTIGLFSASTAGNPALLTWMERRDTVVTMLGFDMDLARLQHIAAGLRPIDEEAWRKLASTAQTREPPRSGTAAVLVASGERDGTSWEASIQAAGGPGGGLCLNLDSGGDGTQICSPTPPPAPAALVGPVADKGFVLATAGQAVARARVVMTDGSAVTVAPVGRNGDRIRFLVAPLPTGATPAKVVALDGDGREIATTALPATPADSPTSVPGPVPSSPPRP